MVPEKSLFKAPSQLFYKRIDGRVVVIDQRSFGWAVLNDEACEHLEFLSSGKTLEEALANKIRKEEIEEFYNAGVLSINGSKKEIDLIIPVKNTGLKLVVLHTSNACNLRCTYCYSNATNGEPMKSEVAITTIDKLTGLYNEKLCLEFHGGEPLLYFDFLKNTVAYANTKKLGNGEPAFSYSIQTNATLIDDEKATFLKNNKFEVGISIDGYKEQNDQNRIFKDGTGTYGHIIRGIDILDKNGVEFGALMTIKSLFMVDNVYDFMLETGIRHLKIGEHFKQGRATDCAEIIRNMKEYAYRTLRLIDKLATHNLKGGDQLRLANASVLLQNILTYQRRYMCVRFPCGAGDTLLGIDVDGSVYPCEEMTGKPKLIIGNIITDSLKVIINSPMNRRLRTRQIEDYPFCNKCPVVSACEVNCPNHSYNETGEFTSISEKCDYYKTIIPELMIRVNDNPAGMKTLI